MAVAPSARSTAPTGSAARAGVVVVAVMASAAAADRNALRHKPAFRLNGRGRCSVSNSTPCDISPPKRFGEDCRKRDRARASAELLNRLLKGLGSPDAGTQKAL